MCHFARWQWSPVIQLTRLPSDLILDLKFRPAVLASHPMVFRSLLIVGFAAACVALTTVVVWSYAHATPQAKPRPSRLDVPWVKSASTDDLPQDGSLPVAELRKLAADANAVPEQRVQAMYLLAKENDWESVEILIAQLNDPRPLVRGRAASAIRHILGTDFYFRAQDPADKRQESIDGIRKYWQSRKSNPPISE